MATHKSAEKRARQDVERNELNRVRRSQMWTATKKVSEAIEKGDAEEAKAALRKAESVIARSAQKGTLKDNTAKRRISRLAKNVKNAATGS